MYFREYKIPAQSQSSSHHEPKVLLYLLIRFDFIVTYIMPAFQILNLLAVYLVLECLMQPVDVAWKV